MTKGILNIIFFSLLEFIIFYLFFSFVALSVNPSEWNVYGRFLYVFLMTLSIALNICIFFIKG